MLSIQEQVLMASPFAFEFYWPLATILVFFSYDLILTHAVFMLMLIFDTYFQEVWNPF